MGLDGPAYPTVAGHDLAASSRAVRARALGLDRAREFDVVELKLDLALRNRVLIEVQVAIPLTGAGLTDFGGDGRDGLGGRRGVCLALALPELAVQALERPVDLAGVYLAARRHHAMGARLGLGLDVVAGEVALERPACRDRDVEVGDQLGAQRRRR